MGRWLSTLTVSLVLLLLAGAADAGTLTRSASVSSEVTEQTNGSYRYEFTVTNDGTADGADWPFIVGFFIPLDDEDDVGGVLNPDDSWDNEVLTAAEYKTEYGVANPFGAAYLLHWYDTAPPTPSAPEEDDEEESTPDAEPEEEEPQYEEPVEEEYKAIAPSNYPNPGDYVVFRGSASGFVLFSDLAPSGGSFLTSWTDYTASPDDAPRKGGLVGGDESVPYTAVVPLPAPVSLGLVGLATLVLTGLARRRRRML